MVDADTAATKQNLDNLEEKANNQISTFALLKNNLKILKGRMSKAQLKTFERSYQEKIEFGKLVYRKS